MRWSAGEGEVPFGTLEPDVLADDFGFVAPVVGPLGKEDFPR